MHEGRASQHEQGLADHELVAKDECEHFAGTSAVSDRDDTVYANDPREHAFNNRASRVDL